MKTAATVARYLLGAGMIVFGLNAFFQFMPGLDLPGEAGEFMGLLVGSGYFNVVALVKVVGGLLLVAGRFVPLGLTLLGPVLVNILVFHLVFAPASIGMGAFFTLLWFVVFARHKEAFRGILSA